MSSSSEDEDPNVNVIPMDDFPSDGDTSTWPVGNIYTERPDLRWRQLLAENWLKDMGTYEDGKLTTDILGLFLHAILLGCAVLRVTQIG